MNAAELAGVVRQALLWLGLLFLVVDLRVGWQIASWWGRRRRAIVSWLPPKPPYYTVNLAIGVMLGILLLITVFVVIRPLTSVFGITMMFIYYGYLLPLSTRIRRGIYEDGIWTDSGFMRYVDIGGLTWKNTDTLVLASRRKTLARRLLVPGGHLGEVRHLLREKIASHAIEFDEGAGLHLGTRDTRESV